MAVIDLVRWAPQGNRTIFAWRFPETNLSTYTQLIVQESQEAVLFSKGQIIGKFGPGKHTLNTENLPILRNLFGIPFGGKNPFTAEVWFVNKTEPANIDWQTDSMSIHDVDYQTQIPLVGKGRYALKLVDAEKFLVKIVGTRNEYTDYDLTDQFYGESTMRTKSVIVQFMMNNNIGFKRISGYLDKLSEHLRASLDEFWDGIGFKLNSFYITSVEIDTSTENGQRVANAIAQQSAMSITGHTWQQEQMFDVAGSAVEGMNSGGNGGMLGGLFAIGMMNGMGGGIGGGMMQPGYAGPSFGGSQPIQQGGMQLGQGNGTLAMPARYVYCAGCSKKFMNDQAFCPHCGKKYNPCPNCGSDCLDNAKKCTSCGKPLQKGGATCPQCHTPVPDGMRFCGSCGFDMTKVQGGGSISNDICTQCGAKLPPSVRFCPRCGAKR